MKARKWLTLLLALLMLFSLAACNKGGESEGSKEPDSTEGSEGLNMAGPADEALADWSKFDSLIADIKKEPDFTKRESMMHEAEDILMDTGALVPIYYYNDPFMMKESVEGVFGTINGYKFFQFGTNGDSDILRINISSEPDRLDPALNTTVDGAVLAVNSFAGLFTYNENNELIPDLVESYELSDDSLEYTFKLKSDLKWSNGDPLDASDFEYSWKRAARTETGSDYQYMFDLVEGYPDDINVKASDDGSSFTVKLSAPCAYFLDLCAFPTFFPVHQESVESAEGYMKDGKLHDPGAWALEAGFVSNGAFTLEEWKHKESMVYKKNPYYHRADDVKLNELHFMLSDQAAAIYNAYQAGDLDFIDSVPSDEVDNVKSSPEWHLIDNLGTYYACFNVKSEALFGGKTPEQAKALRKAFTVAIDREYIIDTVGKTEQIPANTFIPEGMLNGHGGVFRANSDAYSYPNADERGYFSIAPDLDLAREYLKAAGYELDADGKLADSNPLTLNYLTNEDEGHVKIAECIQQDLAELGIDMKIKTLSWDVFLNERKNGNYDLARNGWVADFNDPVNMLEMWTTDSGNNDVQFGR